MTGQSSHRFRKTIRRRTVLRGAAGSGAFALTLAACGGDGAGQTTGTGTSPGATAAPQAALDPTQGKRGGRIVIQQFGDPGGGLELVKIRNAGVHQLAGFTHDGLLEFRNGTPAHDGYDLLPQPNLAQTMPEQPDELTYVYKLRPAKFHNGRTVTSEDVKYSYERYASGADSAYKADFPWLDKVETPDPQTAVVKTKAPYADALQSMAARNDAEILAKEHEESPEHEKRLLGSGPFLFVEYQPPVATRYKRNPEYHRQPYPYFDEIEFLGTSDTEKKVADFIARQAHMTYWFDVEVRDRIRASRKDGVLFQYLTGYGVVFLRCDRPPFNDKRVRQALSMAIDRKQISDGVTNGEGVPDQLLSQAGKYWEFRKPEELGAAAKYWQHDLQSARQLMSAAGLQLPLKVEMPHWNATVVGQKYIDGVVLVQSHWRNAGLVDARSIEMTFGQGASTYGVGNYESVYYAPQPIGYATNMGIVLRSSFWSPPDGIKGPPTTNTSYVNNPELNGLLDKQLTQLDKQERVKTLRAIEDILAEEQYRIALITHSYNYFGDPAIKNMQIARDAYNGALPYVKYWWFEDGKAP